jgi:DNA replication and repair protein RecF
VQLRRLVTRGFRNLATLDLRVPNGLVAILGGNGVGKSNLLEAITVLGNIASFRAAAPLSWVSHGAPGFHISGEVERATTAFDLAVAGRVGQRLHRTLTRGTRRLAPAEYLALFPVVALSAADRLLVWGGPEDRRRFLDRVAFHLHPDTYPVLQRYRRALRQRNALLASGGTDAEIEAFERDLATLGARVVQLRQHALSEVEAALEQELEMLGWSLPRPHLRYHAPDDEAFGEPPELAARLRAALVRSRKRERARGHTVVGPHRHDLAATVAGAPARDVLSAGQGKLLATSLKLAAMAVLERVRGRAPAAVFDDVDAELDAGVLERVLARLAGRGQVFVSSAHEEMVRPRLAGATVWWVRAGQVVDAGPGGEWIDQEGLHG